MVASCTGGAGRSFPTLGFDPAEGDVASVVQVEIALTDSRLQTR